VDTQLPSSVDGRFVRRNYWRLKRNPCCILMLYADIDRGLYMETSPAKSLGVSIEPGLDMWLHLQSRQIVSES
jgi:hypothetical protein